MAIIRASYLLAMLEGSLRSGDRGTSVQPLDSYFLLHFLTKKASWITHTLHNVSFNVPTYVLRYFLTGDSTSSIMEHLRIIYRIRKAGSEQAENTSPIDDYIKLIIPFQETR